MSNKFKENKHQKYLLTTSDAVEFYRWMIEKVWAHPQRGNVSGEKSDEEYYEIFLKEKK